jgi:inosine/uridine nucleosidase
VSQRSIILDCDPGHDDAIAMLLAHGSPAIELLAITTVAGNQSLEKVTHNARAVAELAGIRNVPIAAGCPRPLVRNPRTGSAIHGASGLDGPELPVPSVPLDSRHAVQLIVDTVMATPAGSVTLVPVGPLTNIALALRLEPRIADRVREVVLMGGAYQRGNRTPVTEFNIGCDPEAAHIVFNAPWSVTMVGLEVTHRALATPEVCERIAAVGSRPARLVLDLLAFYGATYREHQGFTDPPVHDPCAVGYVIDPTVLRVRPALVDVELSGGLTTGMTVADFRRAAPDGCSTRVAVDLDRTRFWDLVVDALQRIGDGD